MKKEKYLIIVIVILSLFLALEKIKNHKVKPVEAPRETVSEPELPPPPEPEIEEEVKEEPKVIKTNDLEEALKLAKENGRKIFVVFSAKWCGPCRELHKNIEDAEVQEKLKNFILCEIDTDLDHKNSKRYSISRIPMYFVIDTQEKIIKQGSGSISAKEVLNFLGN